MTMWMVLAVCAALAALLSIATWRIEGQPFVGKSALSPSGYLVLSLGFCWGALHLRGADPVLARSVLGIMIAFALTLAIFRRRTSIRAGR